MTALNVIKGNFDTLRNVEEVELMNMPRITQCRLPNAFKCVEELKMESVGRMKELAELRKWEKKKVKIACKNDWERIDVNLVVEIVVSDYCCKDGEVRVVDLSGCVSLRELRVGDYCFRKTEELRLIGLEELERVVIGRNSFLQYVYNPKRDGMNPNRHFYLKKCPQLRELKIGRLSFMDYSVCEIENMPSLEVIKMGELDEMSFNFHSASLELKSSSQQLR